jgi:nitroreductase
MKDLLDIIKGRRSIRKYQTRDVPQELLDQVLESLRWAPSWANTQCWEVIVVKDELIKKKLQETLSGTNPARNAVVEAPLVFVICGELERAGYKKGRPTTKHGDWFIFDLGLCTQNLCLTAYGLGLGTVIIGSLDHDMAKGILNVPEGYEVMVFIPLGFPAKDAPIPKRREKEEFTHFNQF